MSDSIEELLTKAYSATHELLKDPELRSVVQHGFLISYGPPIPEPDLLLLTFQGGGKSPVEDRKWPNRLLYLDGRSRFGPALRKLCCATGLSTTLESSAMAFPVVFPQAPVREAGRWERPTGPYATWRRHSVRWVERLVDAIRPKVVIVFGDRASRALEMNWEKVERIHSQRHQTFGLSTFRGSPAVYCHHLSQGCPMSEARKCFKYAKRLILGHKSSS